MDSPLQIDVYLETGKKRTFAGAIDWPGWCRSGRDEASALAALLAYGARYARVLEAAGLEFHVPEDATAFNLTERLPGDVTTDFGTPGAFPSADERPIGEGDLQQLQSFFGGLLASLRCSHKGS